jgi:hypothetical protein
MSATKPTAGFDDRFVVPLEPSRRGAHRARVSPVVGALPVVAVVAVVVAVVLLAWTLFGRAGGDPSTDAVVTGPSVTSGAVQQPTQSGQPLPSATVSSAPKPASPPTTGAGNTVDKTVRVTVLNSTTRNGLARQVTGELNDLGWTAARVSTARTSARPTTVFYATTAQKAAAEEIVSGLGVGTVRKSGQFGTGITVVVGTDYP